MEIRSTAFVRARIISSMPQLSNIEKAIAEFFLEHPDVVSYSTITVLANHIKTSETSINRFCKKVGYRGFNDFKVAFGQEYFHNAIMSNEGKASLNYSYEIAAKYHNLIVHTASLMDDVDLAAAANILSAARRVLVYGSLLLETVAWRFKERLAYAGLSADMAKTLEILSAVAHVYRGGDVLVLFTHSGTCEELLEPMQLAQQNGAKVILITQNKASRAADTANVTLVCADASMVETEFPISAVVAPTFIADLLFGLMLRVDKKLNSNWLRTYSTIRNNIYKNKNYDP